MLFQSNDTVSVDLAASLHIEGKIQDKTDHGKTLVSLLVKLSCRGSGMLNMTRYTDPSGKIFYAGRLLKLHDSEGMMLVEKDQHYYFIETQQRFLVAE